LGEVQDLLQAAAEAQTVGRLRYASTYLQQAHARLLLLGKRHDHRHANGENARAAARDTTRLQPAVAKQGTAPRQCVSPTIMPRSHDAKPSAGADFTDRLEPKDTLTSISKEQKKADVQVPAILKAGTVHDVKGDSNVPLEDGLQRAGSPPAEAGAANGGTPSLGNLLPPNVWTALQRDSNLRDQLVQAASKLHAESQQQ
jgi:hypothetical protein